MTPLSIDELLKADRSPNSLDEMLFNGGYPALYDRQLINVQDLELFQRFVRLCAGHSG